MTCNANAYFQSIFPKVAFRSSPHKLLLSKVSGHCPNRVDFSYLHVCCAKSCQSCPTLCDPVDCSLPGSSIHGDSPGKNTGMSCYALLQGIFTMQGSNQGLPHCRQILYRLNHQGSAHLNNLTILYNFFLS